VLAGTPVAGDWNGDGIDAVGIFRTASWYLGMLSQGAVINKVQFQFGLGNSIPLTGHFGDGKHDLVGVVDVNVWRFSDPASRASAFSNPLAILPPADRLPESIHFRLRQTYAEYLEFLASNAESGDSFEPSEGLVQVRSDGFVAVEIHSSIPGFRQRLDDIINGGDPDAQAKLDQENTEFDAFSEALRALGVEATSTQEEFGTRSVSGWLPLSSVPQLPELPHFAAAEASLRALLGSETPTSATSRPNFQTA
jgi:hypothetical protein